MDYIKRQGLVIVEASKVHNVSPKFDKQRKQLTTDCNKSKVKTNSGETESVITIYGNAVNKDNSTKSGQVIGEELKDKGSQGMVMLNPRNEHSGTVDHAPNRLIGNRDSSSSDDMAMDSSGELDNLHVGNLSLQRGNQGGNMTGDDNPNVIQFIADAERAAAVQQGTSQHTGKGKEIEAIQFSHAEQLVREAELMKAHIYDVQGKEMETNKDLNIIYHSSLLDEDYLLVGNYVDDVTKRKIGNGEYIDFARLMPKDKVQNEDDHHMEMVNRGGMSFWVPVADRETTNINSYLKWEQAFRVFSNIYTSYHPTKTGELIQYNHIIHTASQTFAWDNVYRYDREFRIHMTCHHLHRSWGVILQQAWAMFLKDKIIQTPHN